MRKLIIALLGMAAMVSANVQAKEWKTIRFAVDVPYKPFEYKKPDGTLTGFEVDLGNAICAEAKVKCEWVIQAWDGIIPGLQARKYDAIISSMNITEERKKQVAFSEPYYNTPTGFFAAKASVLNPADPASFKGKKIGVQRGTVQDGYATKTYGEYAEVKRYTTGDEVAQDLTETQRLDMVVLDFPVGMEIIAVKEGYGEIGERVQLGDGVGIATLPRNKDLLSLLNKTLATLKTNGTYDAIMNQYFDYSIKM